MTGEEFIDKFGVQCLFHFTDQRNLDLIRAHGLLRLAELRCRAIEIPAPGGNAWSHQADVRHGLDNYVHLCLLREHPMEFRAREEGRIGRATFLQIDRSILSVDGVRFCPGVANRAGAELLTLEEAAGQMDFEVIYRRTDWRDPAIQARRRLARKYEVLVPVDIPSNLIRGL